MAETLTKPTQVETATSLEDLTEATDKEIPVFTARELVLEKYANTLMAYKTKDGTLQIASGSAEAIMMCVFLQDENMGAAYLEGHFRVAAELAATQQSEENEDKPNKDEVITDDVAEAKDSISDDAKTEISDASVSSEQADTSSDDAPTKEQIVEPEQSKEVAKKTISSVQDIVTSKAQPSIVTTKKPTLITIAKSSQPDTAVTEVIDESLRSVSKPVQSSAQPEYVQLNVAPVATSEVAPANVAVDLPMQDDKSSAELSITSNPLAAEPTKTEVTIDNEGPIDLSTTYKTDVELEQSNTVAIDSYGESIPENKPAANEDDQIKPEELGLSNEIDIVELSDEAIAQATAGMDNILVTTIEDTIPTNSFLEEQILSDVEIDSKKDKLYECVKAQIVQLPAETLVELESDNEVLPKHIESAFIDLLEAYDVEDPELQLRIYIERYGVSGLFDAIIEGTILTAIKQDANQKESQNNLAKNIKLARFATHVLTLPRQQSFFHGSPILNIAS